MLKVKDARIPDIKKALRDAGIEVRSIVELYKEEDPPEEDQKDKK